MCLLCLKNQKCWRTERVMMTRQQISGYFISWRGNKVLYRVSKNRDKIECYFKLGIKSQWVISHLEILGVIPEMNVIFYRNEFMWICTHIKTFVGLWLKTNYNKTEPNDRLEQRQAGFKLGSNSHSASFLIALASSSIIWKWKIVS